MKFKAAAWLIVLTCVALLGFQAYLLREAYLLQQKGLQQAFDNVLEKTVAAYDSLLEQQWPAKRHDPAVLDALIRSFAADENLHNELCFAISEPGGKEIFYTSDDVPLRLFTRSPHRRWLRVLQGERLPRELILASRNPPTLILSRLNIFIFGFLVISTLVITTLVVVWRQYLSQKQLSELKTDFINNLTHEFRTPLASIRLATETIKKQPAPFNSVEVNMYADLILDQVSRLQRHVDTVLEAAEQERKGLRLNIQKVNVVDLLEKACAVIRMQYRTARLILDTTSCGPMVLVRADETHLTHVFINILDNGIKYNKQPVPEVKISLQREGRHIRIIFEDNGIGIPRRHLKGIFQKFYRVPQGRSMAVKGFGLGLSYVKQVVTLHGGALFIQSKPDEGTRLEILMPSPGGLE
jgi:signal transduction histidine kinase